MSQACGLSLVRTAGRHALRGNTVPSWQCRPACPQTHSLVFGVPSRPRGEGCFHLSSGLVSLNPCLAPCPPLNFQGLDVGFLLCSNEEGDGALRTLRFPRESRGPSERVAKQSLTV